MIPILDRIKQFLIDKAYDKAEELLEELILIPLRELLENIFIYCRAQDEEQIGQFTSDDFPYEPGALDDYQLPEDFDDFLNNLLAALSPSELCALYKGEATDDLLRFVLQYFKNNTEENTPFANINTKEKVLLSLSKTCLDLKLFRPQNLKVSIYF